MNEFKEVVSEWLSLLLDRNQEGIKSLGTSQRAD